MIRDKCPVCGNLLVMPAGPPASPVLIIGEFPGHNEIRTGIPWCGPAGEVLKAELARAGMQYEACRVTNLWMHAMLKKGGDPERYEAEFNFHYRQLIKEMKGRKALLLLGSEVSRTLLGESVMEMEGLKVRSPVFPPSVKVAIACRNPAAVLIRGAVVGHVRGAIQHFADLTEEYRR